MFLAHATHTIVVTQGPRQRLCYYLSMFFHRREESTENHLSTCNAFSQKGHMSVIFTFHWQSYSHDHAWFQGCRGFQGCNPCITGSRGLSTTSLPLLFFRSVLAILSLETQLVKFHENLYWDFDWDFSESRVQFEEKSCLPFQAYGVFVYLSRS